MRKFLYTATAVLGSVLIATGAPLEAMAHASHGDGMFHWRNFGVDKAYKSREDAINDAYKRFVEGGMPEEAARQLAEVMKTQPCERIVLNNGQRLDFMMSGHGMHRNVQVDFVRPGAHGMQYAAPACSWRTEYAGVVYEGVVPDVCNNLSLIIIRPNCVYIDVESKQVTEKPLHWAKLYHANDVCFAYRHVAKRHEADNGVGWQTPSNKECGCQFDSVTDETGVKPVLKGVVDVTPGITQWRLSPEDAMAFCLEDVVEGEPPVSSFTALVRWQEHYNRDPDGVYRAEVEYASPATMEQIQQMGEMNLWLWASNEQVEQAVYAHATAR